MHDNEPTPASTLAARTLGLLAAAAVAAGGALAFTGPAGASDGAVLVEVPTFAETPEFTEPTGPAPVVTVELEPMNPDEWLDCAACGMG
jgi:hypothetical protein